MSRATSATIHTEALRQNLCRVRELAPKAKVVAVVKADGYGHGLERVAQALEGADAFGVASIADGERLRAAGLSKRIVLLSGFDEPGDLPLIRRLNLDSVVHNPEQVRMLRIDGDPRPVRVWLKFDTGMHRLGFAPADAEKVYRELRSLPQVDPNIVMMSHFARSDEFDHQATAEQIALFERGTRGLPSPRSLANSAGVLGWPTSHMDWVRPGGALYGLSVAEGRTAAEFGLQPVMTLSTRIIAINQVPQGEAIGYGGSFVASAPMRVGIAAIGYGDGYPRHAPSGTPVMVAGKRVATVGRVSMDLLALDLTAHPEIKIGAPVELWGRNLPVEEVADAAETISYELTCGITRRVRFIED